MNSIFEKLKESVTHLEILHEVFQNAESFSDEEQLDRDIYLQNANKFRQVADELGLEEQLYGQRGRQMILADLIEYIFMGRGYYSMQKIEHKSNFIRLILHLVNLLMSYESITASDNLRRQVLNNLSTRIPQISNEELFGELMSHSGTVGLPEKEADARKKALNKYFDSILPKTAGGLWHELLVFIFLLRHDLGYIIPLLFAQRLISLQSHIIPPDYLLIGHDKRIYGIEVGGGKEIQSAIFSLKTSIPIAVLDTLNARTDRCPICHRWIPFCNVVIDRYSELNSALPHHELRCLEAQCNLYSSEQIATGCCPYTKYSRNRAPTLSHAQHDFANGYHYHYQCVLNNVPEETKNAIIDANDKVAIKTHYPFYSGLEELM